MAEHITKFAIPEHEAELRRLQKILHLYHDFQLLLVLYTDPPDYRDSLIEVINQPFSNPALLDVRLLPDFIHLEDSIQSLALISDLIHVIGLDYWLLGEHPEQKLLDYDAWLRGRQTEPRIQRFNLRRESLAKACPKPLLLWLPEYLIKDLAEQAPDFWEWRQAVIDLSYLPIALPEPVIDTYLKLEALIAQLSEEHRHWLKALAVFQDGFRFIDLAKVAEIESEQAQELADALVHTGLAIHKNHGFYAMEQTLAVYLNIGLSNEEREHFTQHWCAALQELVGYLYQQRSQDARLASELTLLELPNLMALLNVLPKFCEPEQTAAVAGRIEALLAPLHQPQALALVVNTRRAATSNDNNWSHAQFANHGLDIEHLLQQNDLPQAYHKAQTLLSRSLAAGSLAYSGADYDLAVAHFLLGRVLNTGGQNAQALIYLQQARLLFQALANSGVKSAARMVSASLTEQGDCLLDLGQLQPAADCYLQAIALSDQRDAKRDVAVGKGQLATVRLLQKDYVAALNAYEQAKQTFEQLGEPQKVATTWHQIGRVYSKQQNLAAAERAYRKALKINSQLGNQAGVALSLGELGNLYRQFGRLEQAVVFYRQALAIYVQLGDQRYEGVLHSNLSLSLMELKRYDEARDELLRAAECKKYFGHTVEPWTTWEILNRLEQACNNPDAAQGYKQNAIASYLAFRRDGGENTSGSAVPSLCEQVLQAITSNQTDVLFKQLSTIDELPDYLKPVIAKLLSILHGERNPALADDSALNYNDAAELLLLLERLR
jgi:tetratricopeptide (TPR) repeat protein